ncbi:MAG: T9SS type A sorting domain-containing protein [Candidatus Zixiibacteriota bacterium]
MKRLISFLRFPTIFLCLFFPQFVVAAPSPGQSISTDVTTSVAQADPTWYPTLILPGDTTWRLCVGDSSCYQISATDPDTYDTLTLSLVEGPISYTPQKFPYQFTTTVCFQPPGAGSYRFIWMLKDKQNHIVKDTVTITVEINLPPTTSDQYFSAELCYETAVRELSVVASDPGNDPLTFAKISGPGTIDPSTGVITYTPTSSGVSYFTVTVADLCGIDTAFIRDSVYINQPPYLTLHDSTFYLCTTGEICLDIPAIDPEGGPVQITLLEGLGTFNMIDDRTGHLCFTPGSPDSATYPFVLCLTDNCPPGPDQICFRDTVYITVVPNHAPVMNADSGYQTTLCSPEIICFNATAGDIDGDQLVVTTNVGTFDPNRNQVCFTADTAGAYTIVTTATDICGASSSDTTVITVQFRALPAVQFELVSDTLVCATGQQCYHVTVTGDGSLQVSSNIGTYNPVTNDLCFTPETSGTYEIIVTAVDQCERSVSDTLTVEVMPGQPPVVISSDDFAKAICGIDTICVPVTITDPENDIVSISANIGVYNAETGTVCFVADTASTYRVITTAVDSCGATGADTTFVSTTFNPKPGVQFEKAADTVGCFTGELCYAVSVTDNDLYSVTNSLGQYNPVTGQVCFTPEGSGLYTLIITATDSCGQTATDTLNVFVGLSRPPIIVAPDTTIYLCSPQNLCVSVPISDPDGNLASVSVDHGTYADGQICFVPYDSGLYRYIFTATDSCGGVTIDTADIRIRTDQFTLSGPGDTTIFLCAPDTICFPIYGIPQDATVRVIGTALRWDAARQSVCFYSECCIRNSITVEVTTACGLVKRYSFTATIQTNTKPTVSIAGDSASLCQQGEACFPVTITDIDNNVADVTATGGTYDAARKVVCVNATATGTYPVTVTATDSCGGRATATKIFIVTVNRPPTVSFVTTDTMLTECDLAPICLPIQFGDPDGNRLTIAPSLGTYNAENNTICFTPTTFGDYQIVVTATDPCGSFDEDTARVSVGAGGTVEILCGQPEEFALCAPGTICVPIAVNGNPLQVIPDFGTYADGQICFPADTAGLYTIRVIANAACNADTCTLVVPVSMTGTLSVTCGVTDTSVFLCNLPDTLDIPVAITGDVGSIRVTPSGTWDNGTVHVPVNGAGDFTVTVSAANRCYVDSCSFVIHAAVNQPPNASIGPDTTIAYCGTIPEVRLHYSAVDPDGNLNNVSISQGTFDGNDVIFTPVEPGTYALVLIATDECGVQIADTAFVTYEALTTVDLTCPPAVIPVSGDFPDSVRVSVPVTPAGANVTVSPNGVYDQLTGEAVVYIEAAGSYSFTVVASGDCNIDTCQFTIEANQYIPPTVTCRGAVDTLLCLTEPTTVCLPVTISPFNAQVVVSPIGTYANGQVCVPITSAGQYSIQIIASDSSQADTCYSVLTVTGGHAPTVSLGSDSTVFFCEAQQVCVPVIISDDDNDVVSVVAEGGTYNPETGQVCFQAVQYEQHLIRVSVTDHCGLTAIDSVSVAVMLNQPPVVTLGKDTSIFTCAPAPICLPVDAFDDNLASVTTSIGTYDDLNDMVCFSPEGSGAYTLILTATDSCGATAVDTVVVTVQQNRAPVVSQLRDTTVYLCSPVNVCLPVFVSDPDNNIVSTTVNRGSYSNGQVCFVPYDSGTYQIILTVTDACGLVTKDTATVTVNTDQSIVLGGPGDTTIFSCQPESLCFPITGVPANATVRVIGTAVRWDPVKQAVCFYSSCCIQNNITVEVTTACGVIKRHQFIARIQTNSKPVIRLPNDTSFTVCDPRQFCFPVSISDLDGNIDRVSVTGGTYDPQQGTVCLTVSSGGLYVVTVSATDSCGATGTDQIFIRALQNTPPVITYIPTDTVFVACGYLLACVPLTVTDADNNLLNVTVFGGTYSSEFGNICIYLADTGTTCVPVIATDICGAKDSIDICIRVRQGTTTDIICPSGEEFTTAQCGPDSVFVPLTITGDDTNVTTSLGTYAGGTVRFFADTAGLYLIRVVSRAECTSDTCFIRARVNFMPAAQLTCAGNQSVFLCSPDTLCYDFATEPSGVSVKVVSGGYLNGQQVCVPIFTSGSYSVTLATATGCAEDTCSFTVTAVLNRPPQVAAGRDTSMTVCTLPEICQPITRLDPDNNIRSITSNIGTVQGSQVCFTPAAYGLTTLIVTVEDSCGAQAVDTVRYTFAQGASATISCPEGDQHAAICGPDSIRVSALVTPSTATVRVLPAGSYDPATGRVSVYVTQAGTYPITVIAESLCGNDTCEFNLVVTQGIAPNVVCPATVDTIMCLLQPDTICFPVTITGTDVQISVSPSGFYTNGSVCLPVSSAGVTNVRIIASGPCGADTCQTTVTVTEDQAPVLTIPDNLSFNRCPDDPDSVCISGISVTDADGSVTITQVCGPGTYRPLGPNDGAICFLPSSFGPIELCVEATDGCHVVRDTIHVTINQKPDCDVCVRLMVDGGPCTPVGVYTSVDLNVQTNKPIGGFDLLMSYDASAVSFQSATLSGSDITGWEYFTYNLGSGNCGSACPSGVVRLVGLAEINNGAHHPPDSTKLPDGLLARMNFLISNDQTLGGQFVPVNFVWYDCGDNSFSDTTGTELYIDRRIYNVEHQLIWDETDDVNYPESARPFGVGASDNCIVPGAKGAPSRCVEYINGGICIIHPDSIDDRGDINLNGLAYEIADAVVFTNYFIKGLSAFTISVTGQIAATDVTGDGLTLTVADLAYLIRVIVGDADPVPKIVPYPERLLVTTEFENGVMAISTDAISTVGAAYIVCDLPGGVTVDEPRLAPAARGMDLKYAVDNGQLKLLVFDVGPNAIAPGRNTILEIPYTGAEHPNISYTEMADYSGRPYATTQKSNAMPEEFALLQNYPNPFNPSTQISFALPHASAWTLQIFNVTGNLVREFQGTSDAGTVDLVWDGDNQSGQAVASGVYLYRLDAGQFSQTRKMVLMK